MLSLKKFIINKKDIPKISIIIPFRDLHKEQHRSSQLKQFIKYMKSYIKKHNIDNIHIFIIEQSNDNKGFNRGILLNAGFDIAKENYNTYIFHDVDLLPSDELAKYYSQIPNNITHIAKVWNRYNSNPKYLGGIVSFNESDYIKINGYPNDFEGHGGEDDSMYNRIRINKLKIDYPTEGSITDLENMNLEQKLNYLRKNKHLRNQIKWELLAKDKCNWKNNGLSDLSYKVLKTQKINKLATKITIEI